MNEKQYCTILGALADKIRDDDLEITILKTQVEMLEKALAKAETAEHGATA